MAIDIIGSEEFSENGSLTVPADTTLILAFTEGTTTPPKVDGVSMGEIIIHEAESIIPGIGIHQIKNPTVGTHTFTSTGTDVVFVYMTGSGYRPGSVHGFGNTGDPLEFDLPSADGDVIFGICRGSVGPTTLEGDEVEMTYIKDSTLLKIGYVAAGAALITCLASDTGESEGYWADGGRYWVDAVIVQGYWTYPQVWQEGFWYQASVWIPAHWEGGVGHIWVEGYWGWETRWSEGHWYTDAVWHPGSYEPAHWVNLPDVWIEAGSGQVSAAFCSIREYPEVNFVSRPIMWG
jgi:hypothetical protein